jgi:hypothetical protein
MVGIGSILLIIALICCVLAAIPFASRFNLVALGLAFLTASMLAGQGVFR